MQLIYGLATGMLFGVLLQKARVLRYDKQVGALRLKDMTIVKFMLSAILTAMIGIYLLRDMGMVELSIKGLSLGGQIGGGLLFGLGWGLLGYCPGTSWGAVGEGRYDAIWGIVGGWLGAALYAEVYPTMQSTVLAWGNFGKVTLPQLFGLNHWVMAGLLVMAFLFLFRFFEKKRL